MTDAIQAMNAGVDPYLLATLQAYNPNFRASQNVVQTGATQVSQVPKVPTATGAGVADLPQADYSDEPDSNTGMVVGMGAIAAGAATLIAGKGNPVKGGQKIWGAIKNVFTKKSKDVTLDTAGNVVNGAKGKLEGIRVKMVNGKPIYNIAGKTVPTTDQTVIQGILNGDKKLARQLQSIRCGTGETAISAGTFTLKDGGHINHITFKGDKIEKILNEKGEDITAKFVENGKLRTDLVDRDTAFAQRIEEYISKIKSCDKDVVRGKDTALRDFTYTTQIGDATAEVTRKQLAQHNAPAGNVTVNKLTTLEDFSADSKEVVAYVSRSRKNGVNIDSIVAEQFVKHRKLPEGYKVQEFTLENGGKPIRVVDGKVEGITIDGHYYDKDTDMCIAYLERDGHKMEKAIEKMIKDALKKNLVPNGATIVPA